MAGYYCQFNIKHEEMGNCRCPKVHHISCTKSEIHKELGVLTGASSPEKVEVGIMPPYKKRVVLRSGQVADLAWIARYVLDSGVKDGMRIAALKLLDLTKE
jgi:hypothetical protein